MTFMRKILNALKIKDENEINHWNDNCIPKYCTDISWIQDSDLSIITEDGRYDLTRFSAHEADTIRHVFDVVKEKYPQEYQSIGLASESYPIKYKPRYVLFESIILLYADSDNPVDNFAVSLAYESKGAYFRKQAIEYFEKSEPYINTDFMRDFVSYMPLHVYTMFAKLYEQEHEYEKAIYYTEKARNWSSLGNDYFDRHIDELLEKQRTVAPPRKMNMSERQRKFEENVTAAAKYFLGNSDHLPEMEIQKSKKAVKKSAKIDVERYAAMCNAFLEHQDEMEKYKND